MRDVKIPQKIDGEAYTRARMATIPCAPDAYRATANNSVRGNECNTRYLSFSEPSYQLLWRLWRLSGLKSCVARNA